MRRGARAGAGGGKDAVKARCVMLYTDGKLSDEIWRVDPDGKF